jgi:hypothetical protein
MALLFMDGFDHYASADLLLKWTAMSNASISAGSGRRSSSSLQFGGGGGTGSKVVPASGTTALGGVAFRINTLSSVVNILGFHNTAANQDHLRVTLNTTGALSVCRVTGSGLNGGSNTVLGTTAAGLIVGGAYNYIELKGVLHASAGTVQLRVNGATVLNLTGQVTTQGTLVWDRIWVSNSGAGSGADCDDLWVCDGTGAAPWNDLLGDCRVDARVPTAAGATTGWTPSTGANWAAVDDAAPNGDTDYVAATTVGLTDTYTIQDAPVVGATIYGVQHCVNLKKSDAGTCAVAPVIRHSGVDYPGADVSPGTTYAYGLQIAAVNPGTGAAWTEAGFNAAEFGVKRTA